MGKEIFIIGGGASLQGFDFSKLEGKTVMAVTTAFRDVKPDYLVWVDRSFYYRFKDEIDRLNCEKYVPYFTADLGYPQDIKRVKVSETFYGKDGLSKGCYCGEGGANLSGLFAISLASALGYEPIFLLGFDGGAIGGRLHYHNRYEQERDTISMKNKFFRKIKGVKVYNCSLESRIDAFPKVNINDVLAGKDLPEIKVYQDIWLHGYLGFGDQLNMRPFVLKLCKKYANVYLTTPFPELYWEKPKNLHFVKPNTHLRLQKKNIEAQPESIWSQPTVEPTRFTYGVGKNILAELGNSLLGTYDFKINYTLPVDPRWINKAKKILNNIHTKKKICVIKPPTIREEWRVETRLPKPEYFQLIIDNFKKYFYFISVADIEEGVDEYYGEPLKGINKEFKNIDIWTTVGLFKLADVVVGFPSFFIPLSIMLKKKAFCIFGGYNKPENYLHPCMDLSNFRYVAPEPFCSCLLHSHNCNKEISTEKILTEFAKLIGNSERLLKKNRINSRRILFQMCMILPDYINRLLKNSLCWFPEKEIGFYPVKGNKYDKSYFDKYVKYENTEIGDCLNDFRVMLVNKYTQGRVLDIGVGCGTFIKKRGNAVGYDINIYSVDWLKRQNLYYNPSQEDLKDIEGITFFDSLEHIEDVEILLNKITTQFVFISLPLFKGVEHILKSKHFRKDEHYFYFTKKGFLNFMKDFGFELLEERDDEIKCGREDIYTFVFKKGV